MISRPQRASCAIGLIFAALAGCETLALRIGDTNSSASAVFMLTELASGQQFFQGSVEVTSASLTKALHDLGIQATLEQKNDETRILATTRGGKKFGLLLQSVPGKQPYTRVSLEWDNAADNQRGLQLFADLVLANEAGARK